MSIIVPEVKIYNTLLGIVNALRTNVKGTPAGEEDILYKLLGVNEDGKPIKINRFNYYQQAKAIILNPEKLKVNFGYNLEVAKDCALHIIMPSESGEGDGIGVNQNYVNDETYTQMYNTTYQIIISSDNSSEVNLVYTILKCMLQMYTQHLSVQGLLLPKISGQDIMFQDNLIPPTLYHKALNLSFRYDLNVPNELATYIIGNIYFCIRAVESLDEELPPIECPKENGPSIN